MYLLYLDESGNPDDPADKHFVLGGIAVYERQTFFLSQNLDALQTKHFPGAPPVEFHASPIRSGKGFWRGIDAPVRRFVLQDIAQVISSALVCVALPQSSKKVRRFMVKMRCGLRPSRCAEASTSS